MTLSNLNYPAIGRGSVYATLITRKSGSIRKETIKRGINVNKNKNQARIVL